MSEQIDIRATSMGIDEQTMRQNMNYYHVADDDVVAKYVNSLGIEHRLFASAITF